MYKNSVIDHIHINKFTHLAHHTHITSHTHHISLSLSLSFYHWLDTCSSFDLIYFHILTILFVVSLYFCSPYFTNMSSIQSHEAPIHADVKTAQDIQTFSIVSQHTTHTNTQHTTHNTNTRKIQTEQNKFITTHLHRGEKEKNNMSLSVSLSLSLSPCDLYIHVILIVVFFNFLFFLFLSMW